MWTNIKSWRNFICYFVFFFVYIYIHSAGFCSAHYSPQHNNLFLDMESIWFFLFPIIPMHAMQISNWVNCEIGSHWGWGGPPHAIEFISNKIFSLVRRKSLTIGKFIPEKWLQSTLTVFALILKEITQTTKQCKRSSHVSCVYKVLFMTIFNRILFENIINVYCYLHITWIYIYKLWACISICFKFLSIFS